MPSSLILPLFFESAEITAGGFAVAAATLAIRVATVMAISSLLNRDVAQPQSNSGNTGGVVQLPPATDNKLPVVYGNAWVAPVITDVYLSDDQQTMWYCLAFSEATDSGTVSFGDIYWDDKALIFDPANPTEIRGWYRIEDNTTVTGVAGDISFWFYGNGSNNLGTTHHCLGSDNVGSEQATTTEAWNVFPGWTTANAMSNTVFAIVRIKYDNNHQVTGLGQIKAEVRNSLKQPGSVMIDYLTNSRYGCGVDPANIDTVKFTALDDYAAEELQLLNLDNVYDSGVRYEINGFVDTNSDCLSNLVNIADNADSWVQWNEAAGKWGVLINRGINETPGLSTSTMMVVTADQIIGGVQVTPLDLNSTYNSIKVQFPNAHLVDGNYNPVIDTLRGQADYRFYALDAGQKFINEPNNQLTLNLPYINDSLQATYIAYKRLFNSREDLTITFTMDYSGIQIDAGDIIAIDHEWYGWAQKSYGGQVFPGKPFRVIQVREVKAADGFLSVQITASSYNDLVYTTTNPHYYTKAEFSGISDPSFISKPDAPTIPIEYVSTVSSTFVVQGNIPAQGNVKGMEFWYSANGSTLTNNNYVLYTTQYYNNGSLYPHYSTGTTVFYEQVLTTYFPAGTYYWRTRAQGPNSISEFSDASTPTTWVGGSNGPVDGRTILDHTIGGSKVITGDAATQGTSASPGFFDNLGKVALAGLGAASAYAMFNKYGSEFFGKDQTIEGGGNDGSTTMDNQGPTLWTDNNNPQIGDEVTMYADVTPQPGPPSDYANFSDYGFGGDAGDISYG